MENNSKDNQKTLKVSRKRGRPPKINKVRHLMNPEVRKRANDTIRLRAAEKKKAKEAPPEIPIPQLLTFTALIETVLNGTYNSLKCSHLLIGASQVYKFLQGKITIADTHRSLGFKNKAGEYAEDAFVSSGEIITEVQPRGRYNRLPFICAVGDYVVLRGNNQVCVEIKSKSSISEASSKHHIKEALTQLWVTLDVLGYDRGEVRSYHITRNENKKITSCRLVRIVRVLRESSYIDASAPSLIDAYIQFMMTYYWAFAGGLKPDEKEIENAKKLIWAHFSNNPKPERLELQSKQINQRCKEIGATAIVNPLKVSYRLANKGKMSQNFIENSNEAFEALQKSEIAKFKTNELYGLPPRTRSSNLPIRKRYFRQTGDHRVLHKKALARVSECIRDPIDTPLVLENTPFIAEVVMNSAMYDVVTTLYGVLPFN